MSYKKFGVFLLFFFLLACAGPSIFKPISLDTNSPVLAKPVFLAIDETLKRGYLINSNFTVNSSDASLMVLDLSNPTSPRVRNAIAINNFSGQAVLNNATKNLYVTNRLSTDNNDVLDQIYRINVDEGSPTFLSVETFEADQNPFGLISDGTSLFAVCQKSLDRYLLNDLAHRTRVDFPTQTASSQNLNINDTREAALSPSGNYIFVSNRSDRMLILNKNEIPNPTDVAVHAPGSEGVDYVLNNTSSTRGLSSDSRYLYVVEGSPPALKVLSEQTLVAVSGNPQETPISSFAVGEIPLGPDPNGIAVDAANQRAYVALSQDSEIAVIDTNLLREVVRISTVNNLSAGVVKGMNPFAVSVGHFDGVPYIYVLNLGSNNISIIHGGSQAVVSTFP